MPRHATALLSGTQDRLRVQSAGWVMVIWIEDILGAAFPPKRRELLAGASRGNRGVRRRSQFSLKSIRFELMKFRLGLPPLFVLKYGGYRYHTR